MAKNLIKLRNSLKMCMDDSVKDYAIPDLWNLHQYPTNMKDKHNHYVNPWHFFISLIETIILPKQQSLINPSLPLPYHKHAHQKKRNWINESVIYSSLVRTSSAYDHDHSGSLETINRFGLNETGTFVKMLALLPILEKMGINTIYLLPISEHSNKYLKGELGSPYAVKNFQKLDPSLKDCLTSNFMTLDEEFSAFVEACHLYEMRVMIDIIPRTMAIDNDWIRDYPDWFYWIDTDDLDSYQVPKVEAIHGTASPNSEYMEAVYNSSLVHQHINLFRRDPKSQNPSLFDSIKNQGDMTFAIKKTFNLSIAPAFSDHINDTQPPWSDITFLRLYLDHPKKNKTLLKDINVPPYILFDTIKANLHPGENANMPLWEALSDIIPSYQKRFGIDGARIDMGHALPKTLLEMIMRKANLLNPNFNFIAEELDPSRDEFALSMGYHAMVGNAFYMIPRVHESLAKYFYEQTKTYKLPLFACAETHDTPRIAARFGGELLAQTITLLNMFVPNTIPFINSAQEFFEKQPMNLGLDCQENERFQLDEHHPYYGKLALFDRYQFSYDHANRLQISELLSMVKSYRLKYLDALTDLDKSIVLDIESSYVVGYLYVKDAHNTLLVIANLHPESSKDVHFVCPKLRNKQLHPKFSSSNTFTSLQISNETIAIYLNAGEFKIFET